jgi:translation initiation factor IF-1
VRVEDVEAAASVHQHLGEACIAVDWVDDQRVLARVGDAVRMILAAEGDGVLRLVEEGGRSLLCGEDLVLLPLALAVGHIHGRPPEDEEDVFHRGEAAAVTVPPSFLASPSFAMARL